MVKKLTNKIHPQNWVRSLIMVCSNSLENNNDFFKTRFFNKFIFAWSNSKREDPTVQLNTF